MLAEHVNISNIIKYNLHNPIYHRLLDNDNSTIHMEASNRNESIKQLKYHLNDLKTVKTTLMNILNTNIRLRNNLCLTTCL